MGVINTSFTTDAKLTRADRMAVAPDYAAIFRKVYRPGDDVEASGIYKVMHERAEAHEVTILHGRLFPSCRHCGGESRFIAVSLAQHIASNAHFQSAPAGRNG
jgi:hypothetical protein